MTAMKYSITSGVGLICTTFGIWLRLAARDLAWPTEFAYSGPREDTIWGIREQAYRDLSLIILGFGLAVLLLLLTNWLWSSAPNVRASQHR